MQIPDHLGRGGSTEIGGGSSTSHPGRSGSGIVSHPLVGLPNGNVFDPIAGTIAKRTTIDVRVRTNLVKADGVLRTQLDAWLAKLGKRGILQRQPDDGSGNHLAYARLVSVDVQREYQHRNYLPMTLVFTVTGLPWGSATNHSQNTATSTTFVNAGNVQQDSLVITLTCLTGTLGAGMTIVNNTTGHQLNIYSPIVSGSPCTIDTGARSITIGTSDAYNVLTPSAVKEEWFSLIPGNNTVTIAVSGGTYLLNLNWADSWN